MKKKWFSLFAVSFMLFSAYGQKNGGMWIPTELNEAEMKSLGLEISTLDIFNPSAPSIKDAIVHFGGGCTGEIISPNGLLLTNHHCGYDEIQSHSTIENDLLSNGFWAKNRAEELPNPGLTATIVVGIENVTNIVLAGTGELTEEQKSKKIADNIEALKKSYHREPYQTVFVKSMYAGNAYYAFLAETYRDVRLVGAPPQSIGKFGSDTDNWVYPRHTGDFSIFRIYADKDNKPAEYSKDNVPYTPKHHLPISIKGIEEGDFTFIFGYPGTTQEYLPSAAIEQTIRTIDPQRIAIRDITLKTLDREMRKDNLTRIKYSAKYARISNAWKKWQGEVLGLKRSNAVEKKREYERRLGSINPEITRLITEFDDKYASFESYALAQALYSELLSNSETLKIAMYLSRLEEKEQEGSLSDQAIAEYKEVLKGIYKDFDRTLDQEVTSKVLAYYLQNTSPEFQAIGLKKYMSEEVNMALFGKWNKKSWITDPTTDIEKLFSDKKSLIKKISTDPFVVLYKSITESYTKNVLGQYKERKQAIDKLQREYMACLMRTDSDRVFFPDANSTLRVSYGKVRGSQPKDGVEYKANTTLDGVVEKYIPGDYEFDVPQRLLELYAAKDFGRYATREGKLPVAFTATNHTTGGNSGSPALDSKGRLVGLNFDRQWEGTMSDIYFDTELCRNIMVDMRYVLFLIDKFAQASWLLDEMTIIE